MMNCRPRVSTYSVREVNPEWACTSSFAAVRRVAAEIGPSELRKITSAGFDSGILGRQCS